jgi:hypothetical protein
MKKVLIFLDDIRKPDWLYTNPADWILVKNFDELMEVVNQNKGNDITISFDNDLGLDGDGNILPDGYACLNWLIDNDIYIQNIIVHSDNTIANEQIFGKSKNWHKFLVNEGVFTSDELSVIKRPAMLNKLNR